jgi:hypothetical protein
MKKFVRLLKCSAVAAAFVFSFDATASAQKPSAKVEQELIKTQNDWAAARVKRDVEFLERLYAKEFRITALDGNLVERAADIANFVAGRFEAGNRAG